MEKGNELEEHSSPPLDHSELYPELWLSGVEKALTNVTLFLALPAIMTSEFWREGIKASVLRLHGAGTGRTEGRNTKGQLVRRAHVGPGEVAENYFKATRSIIPRYLFEGIALKFLQSKLVEANLQMQLECRNPNFDEAIKLTRIHDQTLVKAP